MSYQDTMRKAAMTAFRRETAAAAAAFEYVNAIEGRAIDRAYSDIITQASGRIDDLDPVEAYWFARVHAAIHDGLVAFASVEVGSQPLPDGDADGNQAILDTLRAPMRVTFSPRRGSRGDVGDGTASWAEPLAMTVQGRSGIAVAPGSAPLEVGTTSSMTTFRHLTRGGNMVARWPYGSDRIWLLARVTPDHAETARAGGER